MQNNKVMLITGTSRGIGKAMYESLNSMGHVVYGSSRKEVPGQKHHIILDVTSIDSCQRAVERILAEQGRLDVLINNAGSHLTGASEETSLAEIDGQMQLNFYGAVNMIKAVTPVFLEQKGGKIINMGSLGGLLPLPFTSAYNASKFALEGYSGSLRLELLPYNIYVSNLVPAYIQTGTTDRSIHAPASDHPLFEVHRKAMHDRMLSDAHRGIPMEKIIRQVAGIINARRPRFRYMVGRTAKTYTRLNFLMPERLFQETVLKAFNIPLTISY